MPPHKGKNWVRACRKCGAATACKKKICHWCQNNLRRPFNLKVDGISQGYGHEEPEDPEREARIKAHYRRIWGEDEMATLNILSNFSMASQGNTHTGKQGAAADGFLEQLGITVTGTIHHLIGTLATATVVTVYDDDNDVPADWDYFFVWADQDFYVQVIGSGTNAIFKVEATVPWWISGFDTILAAADTTAITGGSEPSLTDIDSIVLGNYSGSSMNYVVAIID